MACEPMSLNFHTSSIDRIGSYINSVFDAFFTGKETIHLRETDQLGQFKYKIQRGTQTISDGCFNLRGVDPSVGTITTLFRPFDHCTVECILSSSRFIFHEFTFPEQLSQLVDKLLIAQIEQFIPWPASRSIFGRSNIRQGEHGVSVLVAAAPRSEIELTIQALGQIFTDQKLQVYAQNHEALDGPVLISGAANMQHERTRFRLNSRSLAALSLATFAFHYFLWQNSNSLDNELQKLSAEISVKEQSAEPSRLSVRPLEVELVAQKRLMSSVTFVIDEIARLLPDHTWIRSYQHLGNQVSIQGWSHDAARIIGILENSGRFARVEFVGAIEKRREDGAETFHIRTILNSDRGIGNKSTSK